MEQNLQTTLNLLENAKTFYSLIRKRCHKINNKLDADYDGTELIVSLCNLISIIDKCRDTVVYTRNLIIENSPSEDENEEESEEESEDESKEESEEDEENSTQLVSQTKDMKQNNLKYIYAYYDDDTSKLKYKGCVSSDPDENNINKKQGEWVFWNKDGDLTHTILFIDDVCMSTSLQLKDINSDCTDLNYFKLDFPIFKNL